MGCWTPGGLIVGLSTSGLATAGQQVPASESSFPMCDVEMLFYLRLFTCAPAWHMAHTYSHHWGVLGFVVGSAAKWVRAGQQAERGRKEEILVCQLALFPLLIFNNYFLSEPIGRGDPLWSWLTSAGSGCLGGCWVCISPPWAPQSPECCAHMLPASWVAPKRPRREAAGCTPRSPHPLWRGVGVTERPGEGRRWSCRLRAGIGSEEKCARMVSPTHLAYVTKGGVRIQA